LRGRVAHLRRLVADPGPAAVGKLDGILISHLHFDHFDPGTLKRFDGRIKLVVPEGGAVRYLERRGFRNVRGAEPDTAVQLGPVRVRAVLVRHSGSRGTPGMNGPALGYVLQGSRSVYFAGDTDVYPEMAELSGVDVALMQDPPCFAAPLQWWLWRHLQWRSELLSSSSSGARSSCP